MLAATAAILSIQRAAEGAADASAQTLPEAAFGAAFEQAFARGLPAGTPAAREGKAEVEEIESAETPGADKSREADPRACAWAAGLILQPLRVAPSAPEAAASGQSAAEKAIAAVNGAEFPADRFRPAPAMGTAVPVADAAGAVPSGLQEGARAPLPAGQSTRASAVAGNPHAAQAASGSGVDARVLQANANPAPGMDAAAAGAIKAEPLRGFAARAAGSAALQAALRPVPEEGPRARSGAGQNPEAAASAHEAPAFAMLAPRHTAAKLPAGAEAGEPEAAPESEAGETPEGTAPFQVASEMPAGAAREAGPRLPETGAGAGGGKAPAAEPETGGRAPLPQRAVVSEAPQAARAPAARETPVASAAEAAFAAQAPEAAPATASLPAEAAAQSPVPEAASLEEFSGGQPPAAREGSLRAPDGRSGAATGQALSRPDPYSSVQARQAGGGRDASSGEAGASLSQRAARGRTEKTGAAESRETADPDGTFQAAVAQNPRLSLAERPEAAARADGLPPSEDPDASAQLSRAATLALSRGERAFHLKLRPEGLGEVAVTINAGDRELHLTIRAASESTRDLIEGQMGALKSDLASSGYHLGGYSVDVSAGGQGGEAFSAFQQDPGRQPLGREAYARPEGRPDRPVQPAAQAQRTRVLETRAGAINYRI